MAQATADRPAQEGQGETRGPSRWEFVVDSGVLFPTGALQDTIRQSNITAAQLAYVIRPHLAVTTTIGWARARDIAAAGNPRIDIYTYDAGAEFRPIRWRTSSSSNISPFAGLGIGGRTYRYHGFDAPTTHNLAGYVSVGGEFGVRRVRLRVEARDYVSGFQRLNGVGSSGARNDVVAMIGLRIVAR